jgi:EmrB/QacA subfamily drug resistance transporter
MQRMRDQRSTDTDEFPRSEIGLPPAAPRPSNPATVVDRMAPKTVWTLAITSAAVFMVTLDNLVVTTAIPVIRQDLHAGLSGLQWTVNAYTLTFAVLLLTGAALGDRFGRRRLLATGVAIFTAASAGAALAPSILALDVARTLQGVGGAIVMPLTLTVLSAAVLAARRGMALGIWGAISGLAVALGPLVGGAIVSGISWHWIFWLNVPIGLTLLPFILLRLEETHGPASKLDLPGLGLGSIGLVAIVWALIRANDVGWTSPQILGAFILGATLLASFVAWELRTENPLLPMRFFRNRTFALANLASLFMFFGMFGSIFFIAQFFQTVQGLSPFQSGLRILPWTAMPMFVAPIAGVVSDRIGGQRLMGAGLTLQSVGLAWIALVTTPNAPYVDFIGPFAVSGLGMALFFAPVANVVLSSVRPEEEGQASGANNAIRELGGVFGVAVLAAVFTANGGYHSGQQFVDGMNPAVTIGAVLVAIGAIAAFAIKRTAKTQRILPTTDSPLLAACACASCWCTQPGDCVDANDQESPEEQATPAYVSLSAPADPAASAA